MNSAVAVRNGPPLAVSTILATSSRRFPARHWKIALCSLSTGSKVAPLERAASVINAPAVTSASLLAMATVRPASTAAMVGRSPAQPTIAAITSSASPAAASASACSPASARQPLPASNCFNSSRRLCSATTASFARVRRAMSASAWTFVAAVTATTSKRSGERSTRSSVDRPIEPVAPRMAILRVTSVPVAGRRP